MFNYLKKSILILFFSTTPLIAMEFLGDQNQDNKNTVTMSDSNLYLLSEIYNNNENIEPFITGNIDVNFALKFTIKIFLFSHDNSQVKDNKKKLIIIIQKLCKHVGLLTNIDDQNNNIFHAIINKGIPAITALIIAPHLDSASKASYTPIIRVNQHIENIFALLKNTNKLDQRPLDLLSVDKYKNKVEILLFKKLQNDLIDFKQNYPDRKYLEQNNNLALKIHDAYYK